MVVGRTDVLQNLVNVDYYLVTGVYKVANPISSITVGVSSTTITTRNCSLDLLNPASPPIGMY